MEICLIGYVLIIGCVGAVAPMSYSLKLIMDVEMLSWQAAYTKMTQTVKIQARDIVPDVVDVFVLDFVFLLVGRLEESLRVGYRMMNEWNEWNGMEWNGMDGRWKEGWRMKGRSEGNQNEG
jgi:hypothetical protein